MCTLPLPPGVNPIAVDKYININIKLDRYFDFFGMVMMMMMIVFSLLEPEVFFVCPMHCTLRRLLTQRYPPLLTRAGICLSRADK
jgi:hypothetical protein